LKKRFEKKKSKNKRGKRFFNSRGDCSWAESGKKKTWLQKGGLVSLRRGKKKFYERA